ncbi:MAG: aminotransferase class V-fold PLP-dependent enzyme [Vicinamibacterales bacterium]
MGIGGELIGDLEELLATRTLRRKALFRMIGEDSHCHRAEAEIERMYPGMHCLLLPSATIGLALTLEVIEAPPGSEVLITPYGWVANWSCIRRAGLVPRFLPLDDRLQLRADDVARRLTDRTAAVIVTHLLGRGQQEVADIARVCHQRGVPLLEDIAQSFGVSVGGRRAGTFGTAAWCSLNHHKILSTGDGGFALVRDARLFERLCARHDQGNAMEHGKRRRPDTVEPGLSLRTSELTAAVLRAQLSRYHFVRARILALNAAVAGAFERRPGISVLPPTDGDIPFTVLFRRPVTMGYPALAASGWHVAANVGWLADGWREAAGSDADLVRTLDTLATTSAVGSGFVDKYHGIAAGLSVTDTPEDVPRLMEALTPVLERL